MSYYTAESWTSNGGGAQNLGAVKTIDELPEFAREAVRSDPRAAEWHVDIPETDGDLTLDIFLRA